MKLSVLFSLLLWDIPLLQCWCWLMRNGQSQPELFILTEQRFHECDETPVLGRTNWSVAAVLLTLANVGMFFQMMESYIPIQIVQNPHFHTEMSREFPADINIPPVWNTQRKQQQHWRQSPPKGQNVVSWICLCFMALCHNEQETVVCCRISLSLLLLTTWSCWADGIHRDDGLKLSGETPKNTPEADFRGTPKT